MSDKKLTFRTKKGTKLSHKEMDENFEYLENLYSKDVEVVDLTPYLSNGWVNFDTRRKLKAFIFSNGMIHIRGLVTGNDATSKHIVEGLPENIQTAINPMSIGYESATVGAAVRVDIYDGIILTYGSQNPSYLAIDILTKAK